MGDAAVVLGLVNISAGLLIVALCIPLMLRKVAMNPFYGVRIPKAYESEASWYEINAFGGRVMAVAGGVLAVFGIAVLIWPPSSTTSIVLLSLAPVPAVLLPLIPIVRFANRLRGSP